MATVNGGGARGGWEPKGPTVPVGFVDVRHQPNLPEQLYLGAAKAHRAVCYSHYDYSNTTRSSRAQTGRVK